MYESTDEQFAAILREAFAACCVASARFDHDSRTYAKLEMAKTLIYEEFEKYEERARNEK